NFQQSLSFSAYMFNSPLSHEEASLLGAIIRQSETATDTYALLRQLKVTEPRRTFILPGDSSIDEFEMQQLLDTLSTKHLIRTDKSNTLGVNTYVQPTLSGLLRLKSR